MWLRDEPFSARPAELGGFVAAELQQDFAKGRLFAEAALVANPENATLHNNLAFCAAAVGDFVTAARAMEHAVTHSGKGKDDPVVTATTGFIQFRKGDPESGRRHYEIAVEGALKDKSRATAERAMVHWLYEEVRVGSILDEDLVRKLRTHFANEQHAKSVSAKVFNTLLEPALFQSRQARIVATELKRRFEQIVLGRD